MKPSARDLGSLLSRFRVIPGERAVTHHDYITSMVGRHRRQPQAPGPVKTELRHAALPHVDIGLAYSSAVVRVEVDPDPGRPYILQFGFMGAIRLEVDGQWHEAGPREGVVISPTSRIRRESDPGWTLAISLDCGFVRSRLTDHLVQVPAGEPRFQPLVTHAAEELRAYCLLIVDALDRDVLPCDGAAAATLARGLVDLLLETQPHSLSRALLAGATSARSQRVNTVADFIHAHPERTPTVGELAAVAGCSVRSLQLAFESCFGIGPTEFVRRGKLARAREILLAGDAGVTVTDLAQRLGFSNPGQFAGYYRDRYGETPSTTLRRATGRA